jgi:nitrogen fixation protein NifU and related proteins
VQQDDARAFLLDHYENPRCNGSLPDADIACDGSTPLCGDHVHLDLKLAADGATIADARFEGNGCIISQAAASILTEKLIGMRLDDVAALPPQHMLDQIHMPLSAQRVKCALLGLQTAKDGIRAWREKTA